MNRLLKISSILALLIPLLVSCDKNKGFEEEFIRNTEQIGLTIKGEQVFTYDPRSCQLGYNQASREFRVMDDNMSDYFVIELSRELTQIGSSCTAVVRYTTKDDIITKTGVSFTLEKKGQDGLMWLWGKKSGIGAVVRELK